MNQLDAVAGRDGNPWAKDTGTRTRHALDSEPRPKQLSACGPAGRKDRLSEGKRAVCHLHHRTNVNTTQILYFENLTVAVPGFRASDHALRTIQDQGLYRSATGDSTNRFIILTIKHHGTWR